MNYYVDIIDTNDDSHILSNEKATAKSVVLRHNGSDRKDEIFVVGSSLDFTIIHNELIDAKFLDLFTGDENRFRVELRKETDDTLIWTGFILPDSFIEPYTNNVVETGFMATDGIGRLKGKYFDDDFFDSEKSVVQVITTILAMTGLEMNLMISPAIQNVIEKDYSNIFLKTNDFAKDDESINAHQALTMIMESMVCTCYQSNNFWFVEGLNQRHRKQVDFKQYDINGDFVQDNQVDKLIKSVTALATPMVTMVPPYNLIKINHERVKKSLPETIAEEINEGWAVTNGVVGEVFATHWNGNGGFFAKALAPNYKVLLKTNSTNVFDDTKFINLRKKIFVQKGDKFKFSAKFLNTYATDLSSGGRTGLVDRGEWTKVLLIELIIAGEIYSSTNLSFNSSLNAETEFDIVVENSGLMDVKIYQPFKDASSHIKTIEIDEMKLESIAFEKDFAIEDLINDNYTVDKFIELDFADDVSAFSKSFQLAKLDEKTGSYNEITIPVLYGFTQNDKFYSVVDLAGANLISDNLDSVYHNAALMSDLDVLYNYQNGEQMVIITSTAIGSGDFVVRVYTADDYLLDRDHWEQWSDAVYNIERIRYSNAVADVYRRLFLVPHQKIDLTVNNAVKFDDLIDFNYIIPANYIVTNLSWDIDSGETTITMIKAYYQNDDIVNPGDNLLPLVDAGPNQTIAIDQTFVNLSAVASSPDGWIVSVLWEKISGSNGTIQTSDNLDTLISNLTGDRYEYKVTVTDNNGMTASDTMIIDRVNEYLISLVFVDGGGSPGSVETTHRIEVNPSLPPNSSFKLSGDFKLDAFKWNNYNSAAAYFRIKKNGAIILEQENDGEGSQIVDGSFEFNVISTDVIEMWIIAESYVDDPEYSSADPSAVASYNITNFEFNSGAGNVIGLPLSESVEMDL